MFGDVLVVVTLVLLTLISIALTAAAKQNVSWSPVSLECFELVEGEAVLRLRFSSDAISSSNTRCSSVTDSATANGSCRNRDASLDAHNSCKNDSQQQAMLLRFHSSAVDKRQHPALLGVWIKSITQHLDVPVQYFPRNVSSLDLQLHAATGELLGTTLFATGIHIGNQRPPLNEELCARFAHRWKPPPQGTHRASFVAQGQEKSWDIPPRSNSNALSNALVEFANHLGVPASDNRTMQWMYEHIFQERALASKELENAKQYIMSAHELDIPVHLILGASRDSQRGWQSTDVNLLDTTRWSDFQRLLHVAGSLSDTNNSIEIVPVTAFLAEHVLEHLTPTQAAISACNAYRALDANGGYWRIAVPDWWSKRPDISTHQRMFDDLKDGHIMQLNSPALVHLLSSVGFGCKTLEHTDADGLFRYTPWDPIDGNITRSFSFDTRKGISVIIDAFKFNSSYYTNKHNENASRNGVRSLVYTNNAHVVTPNNQVQHEVIVDVGETCDDYTTSTRSIFAQNEIRNDKFLVVQLSKSDEKRLRNAVVDGSMTYENALKDLIRLMTRTDRSTQGKNRSKIRKLIASNPSNVCFQLALVGIVTNISGIKAGLELLALVGRRLIAIVTSNSESRQPNSRCHDTAVYFVSRVVSLLHLSVLSSPRSPQHSTNDKLLNLFALFLDVRNEISNSPLNYHSNITTQSPLGTLDDQLGNGRIMKHDKHSSQGEHSNTRMCFFTMVLNGMPFLSHHIEELFRLKKQYDIDWEWHIVEGFAHGRADQDAPYAKDSIPDLLLNKSSCGPGSTDGTTQYIDQLARRFPQNITVHRANDTLDSRRPSCTWHDKLQMANRALLGMNNKCILVQLDADELWLASQWARARDMFSNGGRRTCAYFDCHFVISPGLVTTTRGAYSHNDKMEWQRMWTFEPGMFWISHAPPRLVQRGWEKISEKIISESDENYATKNESEHIPTWSALGHQSDGIMIASECFSQQQTSQQGLVFTHHAYTTPAQVAFKEKFYGYKHALRNWESLRRHVWQCEGMGNTCGPIRLQSYLSWIHDDAFADVISRATIGAHVPLIAAPLVSSLLLDSNKTQWTIKLPPWLINLQQHKQKVLAIDGVIFQLHMKRPGGIAHVWERLIPAIVERLMSEGWQVVFFQRTNELSHMDRRHFASSSTTKASWSWLQRAERAGLRIVKVPAYLGLELRNDDSNSVLTEDERMLELACNQIGATVFLSTLYTIPIGDAVRVPWMVVHDMLPEDLRWDTQSDLEWVAKHRAIRRAESFIAVSQQTKRRLEYHFQSILFAGEHDVVSSLNDQPHSSELWNVGADKSRGGMPLVRVMPLTVDAERCVDDDRGASTQRRRLIPFAGAPYVLHVGSRFGYKGGSILPQGILAANKTAAGRALLAHLRGLRFVYVGGVAPNDNAPASTTVSTTHTSEQHLWTQLAYLGISAIHVLSLSEHELDDAYTNAVALSYLSHSEGFGLPVLEALKCSCPVLIRRTNVASMHVARGAAVALTDEDVLGLGGVRALVTLLTSAHARRGLVNRGRVVAQEHSKIYTWDRSADILSEAILNSVVDS